MTAPRHLRNVYPPYLMNINFVLAAGAFKWGVFILKIKIIYKPIMNFNMRQDLCLIVTVCVWLSIQGTTVMHLLILSILSVEWPVLLMVLGTLGCIY